MRSARLGGSIQASNPTVSITAEVVSKRVRHIGQVDLRQERHDQHEVPGSNGASDEYDRAGKNAGAQPRLPSG